MERHGLQAGRLRRGSLPGATSGKRNTPAGSAYTVPPASVTDWPVIISDGIAADAVVADHGRRRACSGVDQLHAGAVDGRAGA